MEDISTDEHGVLWDTLWGLGLPEDLSGFGEDLESDVVHDGHVHLWSLISSASTTSLTVVTSSTSSSFLRWVSDHNGVVFDNGVQNTDFWKGVLLDVGVELAALVIDEEHDELEIWVVSKELTDLKFDIFGEALWMKPLPDWFTYGDTKVLGDLRELINKLINGVVTLNIFLTESGVDSGPVLEFDISLLDLFDLEKTVFDSSFLTFGGDDAWWL
jgi:hypothetical protein